ncbi:MAG: hypothetical protein M3347_00680 [Armatimonadota bacterium]|nr:hypothetical protein [Armatimonadota bacterium]
MPAIYHHSRVVKKLTTADVYRRQSEVDDHGEAYPTTKDGPHVYCTLRIPSGLFYLSLYDMNKDGHEGVDRYRDYRISIQPHPVGPPLRDIQSFAQQPELARGRLRDFWGGVYKRFLVRGPAELTVELNRNYSHNTVLAAVMLDLVDEYPPPYFGSVEQWQMIGAQRELERQQLLAEWSSLAHAKRFEPATTETEAADRLFDELERMRLRDAVWWAAEGRQFYAALLRWYEKTLLGETEHQAKSTELQTEVSPARQRLYARLATCCYHLRLFSRWEEYQKRMGLTTARDIEKALRWDGKTPSFSGKGYEAVTAYLSGLGAKAAVGAAFTGAQP